MNVRETGCCGMLELVDISTFSTPNDMVDGALNGIASLTNTFRVRRPFVIFTGRIRGTSDHVSLRPDNYGQLLADYIDAEKLGTVVSTLPEAINGRTGNTIKAWFWVPDYPALSARWNARMAREVKPPSPLLNATVPGCGCGFCEHERDRRGNYARNVHSASNDLSTR